MAAFLIKADWCWELIIWGGEVNSLPFFIYPFKTTSDIYHPLFSWALVTAQFMFAFQNNPFNPQRSTPKDPSFIDTFGQHVFFRKQ